jgi:hypothetical protein
MAFRREALAAINGFDPQFRKAGDDVDLCWRLQQAGFWITFAPGAVVWHHRRQNPRSYLRQQAGYGEAEALLQFKHPDKFNGRGRSKWRGVLYGASLQGLRFGRPIIYRGVFGTGLFQCLYQPGLAHWAMVPTTLEWHAAMALTLLASLVWGPAWVVAAAMFGLSLGVAALQAMQVRLAPQHRGLCSRLLIAALSYAQPLVRSCWRYRARLFAYPPLITGMAPPRGGRAPRLPLTGTRTVEYWTEEGYQRTELLGLFIARMIECRWPMALDSGWSEWDVEIHCHFWTQVRVCTVQEDHGNSRHLIRVRFGQRLTTFAWAVLALALAAGAVALALKAPALAVPTGLALAALLAGWWRGTALGGRVAEAFDSLAHGMNLVPCAPSPGPQVPGDHAGEQPSEGVLTTNNGTGSPLPAGAIRELAVAGEAGGESGPAGNVSGGEP